MTRRCSPDFGSVPIECRRESTALPEKLDHFLVRRTGAVRLLLVGFNPDRVVKLNLPILGSTLWFRLIDLTRGWLCLLKGRDRWRDD